MRHYGFRFYPRGDPFPCVGETWGVYRIPAAKAVNAGVLGIIPGSMGSPAYLVRGKGQPDSLASASHGAGRIMSRTKANKTFKWNDVRPLLTERR